jgi:hypothetical protein
MYFVLITTVSLVCVILAVQSAATEELTDWNLQPNFSSKAWTLTSTSTDTPSETGVSSPILLVNNAKTAPQALKYEDQDQDQDQDQQTKLKPFKVKTCDVANWLENPPIMRLANFVLQISQDHSWLSKAIGANPIVYMDESAVERSQQGISESVDGRYWDFRVDVKGLELQGLNNISLSAFKPLSEHRLAFQGNMSELYVRAFKIFKYRH